MTQEIRNPKSEIRKKPECRSSKEACSWYFQSLRVAGPAYSPLTGRQVTTRRVMGSDRVHLSPVRPGVLSDFGFRTSFGFRISDFGFLRSFHHSIIPLFRYNSPVAWTTNRPATTASF